MSRGQNERWRDIRHEEYRSSSHWQHSGLGIGSFIVILAALLLMIVFFIISVSMFASAERRGLLPGGQESLMALIGFVLGLLGSLTGLGLGIGGLCQPARNKIFAIIGTVLSGLGLMFSLIVLIVSISR